jgi:hypothetical protein
MMGKDRAHISIADAPAALARSAGQHSTAVFRRELRVRAGKGRKERLAYATDGAKLAPDAWLAVRGNEASPLFRPADGRGRALVNRR